MYMLMPFIQINLMQQDVLYVLINHGQTHWTLLVKT